MQPAERINKLFLAKLFVLSRILYLGFVLEVPQFIKASKSKQLPQYASPEGEAQNPKQIQQLYYRLVSDTEPEEVAI